MIGSFKEFNASALRFKSFNVTSPEKKKTTVGTTIYVDLQR